jgi:hypothetical protein
MSEVLTQRRPDAGLDETLGRFGPPFFDVRNDGDLLAELFRIIAGQEEPHSQVPPQEDDFALSKGALPDQTSTDDKDVAGTTQLLTPGDCAKPETSACEERRTTALVPHISGDFAAIEAGLLGGLRDDAAATAAQTSKPHVSQSPDPATEQRSIAVNRPDSRRDGAAGRARLLRRHYAVAALLLVALAATGVNFGLDALLSTPADSAATGAGNVAETSQMAASSEISAPAVDAASLSAAPEQPAALSAAQRDDASAAAPDAIEQPAPKVPEPITAAGPAEPDAPQAMLAQPDSPPPQGSAPTQAKVEEALPPVQQPGPAADASGGKPVAQPAKPPAAHKTRHPASQGHARHVAKNGKTLPGSQPAAGQAPGTETRAETPTPQPAAEARPANDPLALVQGAINSFASAAAKIFEPGQR